MGQHATAPKREVRRYRSLTESDAPAATQADKAAADEPVAALGGSVSAGEANAADCVPAAELPEPVAAFLETAYPPAHLSS